MSKAVTESEKKHIINTAVKWARDTAYDDSHGYSLSNFTGPDYKCTTLVYFAWHHAGVFKENKAYVNRTMSKYGTHRFRIYMDKRDDFKDIIKKVNPSTSSALEKGDILIRDVGTTGQYGAHVALYNGGNRLSEAAGDSDGRRGDGSGNEIHTTKYYNYSKSGWNHIYRYTPKIATAKKTKTKKSTKKSKPKVERSKGKKTPSKSGSSHTPYQSKPLVRDDLDCSSKSLTDFEKNYCTFKPVQGGEAQLQGVVQNVLSTAYLWAGIIAVIVIVIGGIKFMTSAGDPDKVKNAKNAIMYAVIGLIVTLMAFAITNFIIGALEG